MNFNITVTKNADCHAMWYITYMEGTKHTGFNLIHYKMHADAKTDWYIVVEYLNIQFNGVGIPYSQLNSF